jgi:hypothetical protein
MPQGLLPSPDEEGRQLLAEGGPTWQMERWPMESINLFREPKRFAEIPRPAKLAIITMLAGWLAHFTIVLSLFKNQFTDIMLMQHFALAVVSTFVLLRLKNWARILCITGNTIVILFYLLLFATIIGGKVPVVVAAMVLLNLLLFGASTFFLWNRETTEFFKQQSVKSPPAGNR